MSPSLSAKVIIEDARARETQGPMSAAYLKMTSDRDDYLISAWCSCSQTTEIHRSLLDEQGVMRMRPIGNGIKLPRDSQVELKPGGVHIMFMQLKEPLKEGGHINVVLNFESAGEQMLTIPVLSNSDEMMNQRDNDGQHTH